MSDQSSKKIEINKHRTLQAKWSIDFEEDLYPKSEPPPVFNNDVEKIIYTLEHENDPLTYDQILEMTQQKMAESIMDEVDREIMEMLQNKMEKK